MAVLRGESIDRRRGCFDPDRELLKEDSRRKKAWEDIRRSVNRGWRGSKVFRERLAAAGIKSPSGMTFSRLETLPVIRKRDLPTLQQVGSVPLGGLLAVPLNRLAHVFMSPGPIYDPGSRSRDPWGARPALYAAGFRPGDIGQVTFAYHFSPAGMLLDKALIALGCAVVPAGVGNTEAQVTAMKRLGVTGYVGTASFLKIIIAKAAEMGFPFPGDFSLQTGFISGEALTSEDRDNWAQMGIMVRQTYITADVGTVAYECPESNGFHIAPDVLVQICDPETGSPLPDGEIGEVVVTKPSSVYPLVRFATGDLSVYLDDDGCPCGRGARRLQGILGRTDQVTKVRGMFVHPHQVQKAVADLLESTPIRLVVDKKGGLDSLTLQVAAYKGLGPDIKTRLKDRFREVVGLRVEIEEVPVSEIPDQSPIIIDRRPSG